MTKHIIAVIDRSGSMTTIVDDMNGGIQNWLGDMVAADPDALLTSILFDDRYEETNVRTALKNVQPSSLSIRPRGSTALNDAIMRGLGSIKKGEDALVLIVTDGQENASKEATSEQVKKRITELEKKGVTFQYLSASADAFADAAAIGLSSNSTWAYNTADKSSVRSVAFAMTQSGTTYLADTDTQEDSK